MALAVSWLSADFATAPQLTPDAIERAATAAGLEYAFLPVQSAYQTPDEIARMHALLARLPKPILAFCRSGARTSNLFHAARTLGSEQ